MINKQWLESNTFNWTDLHGKELKILVGQSIDDLAKEMTTVVTGWEVATGHCYVLHNEIKRV